MDIKLIGKVMLVIVAPVVYLSAFVLLSFITVLFCNWFDELKERRINKR